MPENQFSRRAFLLGSLLGLGGTVEFLHAPLALAKHAKTAELAGPHPLARQDWPPAIVPDHIGADRGYCIFTDEFGRLAVVDMRKLNNPKAPPHVVAELNGLGKKVIDFKIVPGRGYGAVLRTTDAGDSQLTLVCVNLAPATDPSIIGTVTLDRFSDVASISANGDLVCVGGTSVTGENLIAIFSVPRKGKQAQPMQLSTWLAHDTICDIDVQDRHLAVLQPGQLDYVSLVDPRVPEPVKPLKLDGDFKIMSRSKDCALLLGTGQGKHSGTVAVTAALEPAPRVVSELPLDPITSVLDSSSERDRFVVLGDGANDRYIMTLSFDKGKSLHKLGTTTLAKEKGGGYSSAPSILLSGKTCYLASGWTGVQVLSSMGNDWAPVYKYSIPRLPASSIATWGDNVVLASSDLKLYDIAQPARPALVTTADVVTAIRAITGAGSYVLCLSRDSLSLRKMDNLGASLATCNVAGQQICYDKVSQKAFVLNEQGKKTVVTKVKAYSNALSAEGTFELPASFNHGSANGGYLAVCGLNDISLYGVAGDKPELIGSRHFENLAIRDVCLLEDTIVAAAVDQRSKGFLLTLSKDQKDLKVLGSFELPHDAVALAAEKNRVVLVGKSNDGKDIATVVDISASSTPKLLSTIPAIEAASVVAIKDKLAIIGGRGIEIVSLS